MNLFDIRLNEEGVRAIRKFVKFARWAAILTIIIMAISLLEAWTSFFLTKNADYSGNRLIFFQTWAHPFYMMIYCVLGYIQVHYYLKAARQLSVAIRINDEVAFNRSFISLVRNSIFAILGLSVGFLMIFLRILVFIGSYYW